MNVDNSTAQAAAGSRLDPELRSRIDRVHDRIFAEDGSKRTLDDAEFRAALTDAASVHEEAWRAWHDSEDVPQRSDPEFAALEERGWYRSALPWLAAGAGTSVLAGLAGSFRASPGYRPLPIIGGALLGVAILGLPGLVSIAMGEAEPSAADDAFHQARSEHHRSFVPEWLEQLPDAEEFDDGQLMSHYGAATKVMRLLDHSGDGELTIDQTTTPAHDERLAHLSDPTFGARELTGRPPTADDPAVDYSVLLNRADADADGRVSLDELADAFATHVDTDEEVGIRAYWALQGSNPGGWTVVDHARDAAAPAATRDHEGASTDR